MVNSDIEKKMLKIVWNVAIQSQFYTLGLGVGDTTFEFWKLLKNFLKHGLCL